MKQLLFLLLFPCFALAQYQGNANQKITLGEQTTADGLVWRGIRADTTSKIVPFSDTSAYIILDTVEKTLWLYKAGQVPKWQQVGGSAGGGGTGTVTSITAGTGLTGGTITTSGTLAADTSFLFTQSDTLSLNLTSRFALKLNISDTASMLSNYNSRINLKVNISDTTNMLNPYFRDADTTNLNLTSRFAMKQNNLTLTTTGTSGAATLSNDILNIPQYSGGGGSTLDTATMLLPYYRAGRNTIIQAADVPTLNQNTTGSAATLTTGRTIQTNLASTSAATFNGSANITPGVTGTLPVANGGTNTSTAFTAGSVVFAGASGTYSQDNSNLFWDNTNKRLGIGTTSPTQLLHLLTSPAGSSGVGTALTMESGGSGGDQAWIGVNKGNGNGLVIGEANRDIIFQTGNSAPFNGTERMRITSGGEVWIGYTADNGAYPLQVNGQIFATNATIATSDEKFKENITPLNKGLEIVNKLKPVTFNFISDTENNFSEYEEVGFIAQDVDRALSTETFSKSIVKAADDSEPTSTMGLATQNLIPILVKAIQEQQTLIKALEQRILILENK